MTTSDEKAPFMLSMEERVQQKIKEKGITIPKEILAYVKSDQDKPDDEEEIVKENAKIHYDKEDLISFH